MAVKGKGKEVASASSSKRPRHSGSSADVSKKKRRSGVLKFVDDSAYVAESDEEEDRDSGEEDYADFWEEIEKEGKDAVNDTKGKGKAVMDDPKPKERSFIPFLVKEEELSGDELEELIKERYGRGSGLRHADFEDDDVAGPDPTKDPTLWRLKTGVGRERQVVFCFMQKYVDFHNRGNKLQIFSAFSLDHVKGFVYVEADKACDVTEACKGFYNVYPSRITAVPTNEVPQLLATRNKPNYLSKGTWVRMKTGNYKGDIAQVVSVDDAKRKVMIKLVPRIDLRAISKKFGGAISLKNAEIPPARLINPRELEVFRPHIEAKRDRETGEIYEILDGNMLKNGYLFKRVALTSLIYWGVEPTEQEKNRFTPPENEEQGEELEGWVSDLYHRKKKKTVRNPSSADLKASSSAQLKDDGDFEIHDLVLFGKKDFGVFLGREKDGSYKILKSDTEKSVVVTLKRSEIKKVCSDKMFTALDKNKKTISINDPVDVTMGPSEGKKGVVKHMYRGVLFIHSEDETENSGYFCAKSEHCENTKKPKELPDQSFGGNMDDNSASFFPPPSPSPFQSFDQQDNNSRERRRPERESQFSIGQTLRIRKGPLKGYLCRVVRMWRNDVTVKLDSLVKTITVNAEHLSDPSKKGQTDGSGAAATTDGAQDGGSSWDTGLPSLTSDTWQPFGSSAAGTTETGAGGDGDPWGSKVPSTSATDPWNTDNSDKPSDAWAQPSGTNAQTGTWQRDDDSNKNTSDDPWGKAVVSEEPSGWGNTESVKTAQIDDPWGNNDKGKAVVSEESSGWGNTESVKPAQIEDPWGNNDKGKAVVAEEPSGWGNTETVKPAQTVDDPWGKAVSKDPVDSDAWGKGKTVVSDEPSVKTDSWDAKGKGNATSSDDPWGNITTAKNQSDTWGQGKEKTEGGDTGWGSKSTEPTTQNASDNWGSKGNNTTANNEDNSAWGKVTKSQETDTWGAKSDDAWSKPKEKTEGGETGWGSGGNASWDKPNSSNWNKDNEGDNNNNNQRDSWTNNNGGSEGGRGRGRGRGRWRDNGGESGGRWRDNGGESGGRWRDNGGESGGRWRDNGGESGGRWRDNGGESGGSFRGRSGGRFGGRGGRGDRDGNNSSGFGGSSWNSGDKGGDSTWGKNNGGDSSWGKNNGGGSSWGGGGNSQADGEKKTDWGSSSWSNDESSKGVSSWNASAPQAADEPQGAADPWGDKLIPSTGTDTKNDAWGSKAEDKSKETNTWGSKPASGDGTSYKADAWGSKAEAKDANPWGAKTTETETQTGEWNTGGSSSQAQTDTWGKSGNDSDWSKPRFDLNGGDNNNNNNNNNNNGGSDWSRPRWNSDGGDRGGRRGGRGRNFGDRDSGNSESWRQGDRDNNGGRGRGRSFGDRDGGNSDRDSNGGRGNWRGRGGRWNRDENRSSFGGGSWNRDENKSSFGGGSWNSGGGGGGGSWNSGGGGWNKDENKSSFGGGGGSSSWAADQGSSWGKNNDNNTEKKSSDWGGWGTGKDSSGGADKEKGNTSGWGNSDEKDKGNSSGWGNSDDKGKESAAGWGNSDEKDKGSASAWSQDSDRKDKGSASGWNEDSDKKDKGSNWGGEAEEKGKKNDGGNAAAWDKPTGGGGGWDDDKGGNEGASTAGW